LAFEYQRRSSGIEQDLAAALSRDGEAEWSFNVIEDEVAARSIIAVRSWASEDGFWNLIDLGLCILDQDMESRVCINVSTAAFGLNEIGLSMYLSDIRQSMSNLPSLCHRHCKLDLRGLNPPSSQ
jgi:hypothetical protein